MAVKQVWIYYDNYKPLCDHAYLQEGVLHAHHFITQISPLYYRYIIKQSICMCMY